jgi:AcrR family transcriptional regulator
VSSARDRILEAARQVVEQEGSAPSMSALARAVGISRQALYLHFSDRTQLLLALVVHIDDREQLQAGVKAIREAADAAGQIRAWARMQVWRNPTIAAAARALDSTRHTDPAAAAAWQDRADNRMRCGTFIAEGMHERGQLHPTWTVAEAAVLLWELTSFHVWDDLVNGARLPPDRYVEIITSTALAALAAPAEAEYEGAVEHGASARSHSCHSGRDACPKT